MFLFHISHINDVPLFSNKLTQGFNFIKKKIIQFKITWIIQIKGEEFRKDLVKKPMVCNLNFKLSVQ